VGAGAHLETRQSLAAVGFFGRLMLTLKYLRRGGTASRAVAEGKPGLLKEIPDDKVMFTTQFVPVKAGM
jgi:hypothetical protein